MASFAQALRDFDGGSRSEVELLAELDAVLADERTDPAALLAVIDQHDAEQPLPEALATRLRDRIHAMTRIHATGSGESADATQLATVMAGRDPPASAGSGHERADDATVIAPTYDADRLENPPARVGDLLSGRFYLDELIGDGGMSLVFRAVDRLKEKAQSRNPYVAVKVLDVAGPSEQDAFMALQREAQKSQTLNHPNIVRVHDFHQDGDTVFMTMEYITGVPLSSKLRGSGHRNVSRAQALKYIRQMGDALVHAHDRRILHADFKPSNIIITEDDDVKVIDFGIARAFRLPDDADEEKTRFQVEKLGALTPAYASAEMIEHKEPDPRDDVYSLACVAYQLLTGRHPFSLTKATAARDAKLTVRRPQGLSYRQWRALRRGLAFDRADRTPSVREFLRELVPRRTRYQGLVWAAGVAATIVIGVLVWLRPSTELSDIEAPAVAPVTESAPPAAEEAQPPVERQPRLPAPGDLLQDCPNCPTLVVLPAGRAVIGAEPEGAVHLFESPPHEIHLSVPIAMGITEVTVGEFAQFANNSALPLAGCATPRSAWQIDPDASWREPGYQPSYPNSSAHPVTCVSWDDAQAFAAWLSDRTGSRYRLPSEAEWEYAARAGRGEPDPVAADSEDICSRANVADRSALTSYPGLDVAPCADGFVETAPAATGLVNEFKLRGMRGNVYEWTQDCWNPSYEGAPDDGQAWEEGDCTRRVLRGGSWFTAPAQQRLTFRNRAPADYRSNTFGFRLVREITP